MVAFCTGKGMRFDKTFFLPTCHGEWLGVVVFVLLRARSVAQLTLTTYSVIFFGKGLSHQKIPTFGQETGTKSYIEFFIRHSLPCRLLAADIGHYAAGILVVLLCVASMDTSLGPLCDPFPGAIWVGGKSLVQG